MGDKRKKSEDAYAASGGFPSLRTAMQDAGQQNVPEQELAPPPAKPLPIQSAPAGTADFRSIPGVEGDVQFDTGTSNTSTPLKPIDLSNPADRGTGAARFKLQKAKFQLLADSMDDAPKIQR